MRITHISTEQQVDQKLLELHTTDLKGSLEQSAYLLSNAVNKVKMILSRKNLVGAMTTDEQLDMILLQKNLEGMVTDLQKATSEI